MVATIQVKRAVKAKVILSIKKTPSSLTRHIALRGRKYDDYCREFLESHPDGLIVSLGCGLDTRFYRLGLDTSQYIELDLPEMIEIKGTLLGMI